MALESDTFDVTQSLADEEYVSKLSAKDAFLWADAKMKAVNDYFTSLNSLRNSLLPVYDLPKDVMVEIFWLLAQPAATPTKRTRKDQLDWIRVTHVCRSWREIALSQPKLWSFVDLAHLKSARAFLERSNHPIQLFTSTYSSSRDVVQKVTDWMKDISEVVTPQLHRVASIDVRLHDKNLAALVKSLTAPMTLITMVHLRGHGSNTEELIFTPVLGGGPSKLTSLHLEFVTIPWESPLYYNLVHLKLRHRTSDIAPSIEVFTNILENCPRLQTLDLRRAGPQLPEDTTQPPPPTKRIQLPQLHRLHLENNPVDIKHLLSYLDIPSTTTLIIKSKFISTGEILPPNFTAPNDVHTLTLMMHLSTSRGYRETEETELSKLGIIASKSELFNAFRIALKPLNPTIRGISISCYNQIDFSADEWTTVFANMNELRSLDIEASPNSGNVSVGLSRNVLPKLHTLEFTECLVDEELLVVCVTHRAKHEMQLEKLGIYGVEAGLKNDTADKIKAVVDKVDVGPEPQGLSESQPATE